MVVAALLVMIPKGKKMMTIFEAYNSTKKKLEKAGIEDSVFEARQIIKHITGFSATQILANYNNKLTEFQANNLIAIVHQREVRYPLQYILGNWDFYGRTFDVGVGVLVPRADTETVIDVAIDYLKEKENPQILDLCAGSGCIGITLAKEIETSNVLMIEKYMEAFRYTLKNVERNAATNAKAMMGDIFEKTGADGVYDLIVSNPPYIPENEMSEISPETKFEPETALLAEDGGMEFYKAIINNYTNSLKKGGMMLFEVGIGESQKVMDLLQGAGFSEVESKRDLGEIERAVFGIK